MTIENKASLICAKLISKKVLPKEEVKELFRDENLRSHVEDILRSVGLELATHIYTDHVALKVCKDMEAPLFDDGSGGWLATNIGLSRGAVALLVILWAKLILPKRQVQIERRVPDEGGQISLLKERKPIPMTEIVKIEEKTLLADFVEKLGGKTRFSMYLGELSRHGFIQRREGVITEGPMLDTVIDYSTLASRIIEGCLAEVVGIKQASGKEGGQRPASKGEEDVSV